jgi:hypothetical protein
MDIWFTTIGVRMRRLWSPKGVSRWGSKEVGRSPLWQAGHHLSPNVLSLGEKPHWTSRSLVQASPSHWANWKIEWSFPWAVDFHRIAWNFAWTFLRTRRRNIRGSSGGTLSWLATQPRVGRPAAHLLRSSRYSVWATASSRIYKPRCSPIIYTHPTLEVPFTKLHLSNVQARHSPVRRVMRFWGLAGSPGALRALLVAQAWKLY